MGHNGTWGAVGESGESGESCEEAPHGDRILGELLDRTHFAAPGDIPSIVTAAAAEGGVLDVALYVADYEQLVLVPLRGQGVPERDRLGIDQTMAGRAYRTIETLTVEEDDWVRVWTPLLNGTSRLGVLEARVRGFDTVTARTCRHLAAMVANLLVTKDQYTDAYHLARRTQPLGLAAELQYSLLPPLTFSDGRVLITGALEPSYAIAGDTFDYAVDDGVACVALIDAMGHGFEAAVMSSVVVHVYRHSRRRGHDLVETYLAMDRALAAHTRGEGFATAQLLRLDATSGTVTWVAAGHPPPLLVRGTNIIGPVVCTPSLPLGFQGQVEEVGELSLEPGDRLLLLSDGVLDARSTTGDFFGDGPLEDFLVRAVASGLPAPEVLRRLSRTVMDHQDGRLQDDATTLLLEWHGRERADPYTDDL
jgi:serine phosphatase RsbU (regulator of sigma subunit)